MAKVIPMNNNYLNEQAEKKSKHTLKTPRRRHLGIILLFAIVAFSLGSMRLVSSYQNLQKQVKLEQQAEQTNKTLTTETSLKSEEVKKLQDPSFLEKYARARYNYGKSGEKIFSIPALVNGGITP